MRSKLLAIAAVLLWAASATPGRAESVFLVGPTADCNPTFRPTGRVDFACRSNRDILDFERGVQISCSVPIGMGWAAKPNAAGFRPIVYAQIQPTCRQRPLQAPVGSRDSLRASAAPPADRTGSVLWLYNPSRDPEVAVCVSLAINYNLEGVCGKAKIE
jgi:hypothetical protein